MKRIILVIPVGEGYLNALLGWLNANKKNYTIFQNPLHPTKREIKTEELLIVINADKVEPVILEEVINDQGIKTLVLLTHDKNFRGASKELNRYEFANLEDFTRDIDKLLKLSKYELKKMLVKYYIGGFDSIKPALEDCKEIGEAYDNGQAEEIENALSEVVSEIKSMYGLTDK